jgi:hypothetical protein
VGVRIEDISAGKDGAMISNITVTNTSPVDPADPVSGTGMVVILSRGAKITRSTVANSASTGIEIDQSTKTTIDHTHVDNSGGYGIVLSSDDATLLDSNAINNSFHTGIVVDADATKTTLKANRSRRQQGVRQRRRPMPRSHLHLTRSAAASRPTGSGTPLKAPHHRARGAAGEGSSLPVSQASGVGRSVRVLALGHDTVGIRQRPLRARAA